VSVLETLDAMISGILRAFDAARTLLLITSDHGNIEDLSVKTHTRHPVPLVVGGAGSSKFAGRFGPGADLTDVCPALLEYIGIGR